MAHWTSSLVKPDMQISRIRLLHYVVQNYYSECFNNHPVYSFNDDGDWTFINSNCVEKNIVKYIKYDSAGNKIIFERSRDGEVNYGEYNNMITQEMEQKLKWIMIEMAQLTISLIINGNSFHLISDER